MFKEGDMVRLRPKYRGLHKGGYDGVREVKCYGSRPRGTLVIFRDESIQSGSTGQYIALRHATERWEYAPCVYLGGE